MQVEAGCPKLTRANLGRMEHGPPDTASTDGIVHCDDLDANRTGFEGTIEQGNRQTGAQGTSLEFTAMQIESHCVEYAFVVSLFSYDAHEVLIQITTDNSRTIHTVCDDAQPGASVWQVSGQT